MSQTFLDTTTHSVSWINKRDKDGELEIRPAFQRKPVWTDKQKAYLIDSILRGYPIPELYIQEYTNSNGDDKFVVVDGQQRIRACLDFIKGRFCLESDDQEISQWEDFYFDDLNDEDKKRFFGYNLVVRKLPEMPELELRAVFKRINRNVVALNKQELRHATYWGKFIKCCEDLANEDEWSMFGIFTPNDFRRMLDVEFVSELVVAFVSGVQNKKNNLEKHYISFEEEFERDKEVRTAFRRTLSEISAVLPDLERSRWKKKSDFYTLFHVFVERSKSFPLSSGDRKKLSRKLENFSGKVEVFFADADGDVKHDRSVRSYCASVQRAASDLGNRRTRKKILDELFNDAVGGS